MSRPRSRGRRANVDQFGGDRNFVAVGGLFGGRTPGGAGRPDRPTTRRCSAELPEGSDTSVDAVVGIYGRYDWEDRSTARARRGSSTSWNASVVERKISKHPDVFRKASPIARVHKDAPPFLVIHGTGDSVIPVEQARSFVERYARGVAFGGGAMSSCRAPVTRST